MWLGIYLPVGINRWKVFQKDYKEHSDLILLRPKANHFWTTMCWLKAQPALHTYRLINDIGPRAANVST